MLRITSLRGESACDSVWSSSEQRSPLSRPRSPRWPAGAAGAAPSASPVGQIFMVNPVQSSGDETLVDAKDSDSAVPASDYVRVPLRNLDGSGHLSGKYVVVRSSTGALADAADGFVYTRHADQFEQVMAYFWVERGAGIHPVARLRLRRCRRVNTPTSNSVRIDQFGADNSFFSRTSTPKSGTARAAWTTPRTPR